MKTTSYLVKSITDTLLDSAQSWTLDDIEKLQERLENLWDEVKADSCEYCCERLNGFSHESGEMVCKECAESSEYQLQAND